METPIDTNIANHLDVSYTPSSSRRVDAVDLLRGLVMVVMVLDHVRDYFGDSRISPTDLQATTPALFFTRWITHFCAPTFMFLAGISASFTGERKSRGELSRYLITRGLWLIFLEQTWGNVCIFFTYPHVVLAMVLWAIGWSMIALGGLIYLSRPAIGALGVTMIAMHNLFDNVPASGNASLLWSLLHRPGFQFLPGGIPILVGYPLIPWIGVMAAGYALGPVLLWPRERRRPILLGLGAGAIVAFVVLHGLNVYGDPQPWSPRSTPLKTVMSFLNCQKYPPSLLYLLMTLGPALLMLVALDRDAPHSRNPLRTFGRVPLFFYLLQWPVAHGLAVLVAAWRGEPIGWLFRFPPFENPEGYGQSLVRVYIFWVVTVAILYYPSAWYARRKRLAK